MLPQTDRIALVFLIKVQVLIAELGRNTVVIIVALLPFSLAHVWSCHRR